ncbi:MAG: hypothetical protein A3B68_07990 [Candidatus Melainabacteria bacterium RIFCSPHIGHO2_02_FULL_34_12]|nr:MAG: hypothetical protein A3B68_07990 [Candidatus Melainabacteria bacterium RIFCSPHIGHO2_02_FULL_34_12]
MVNPVTIGRVALFIPKAAHAIVEGAYYGFKLAWKNPKVLSRNVSRAANIAFKGSQRLPENEFIRNAAFNTLGKGFGDIFTTKLVTKEGLKLVGWDKALHMAGNAISLKSWQQAVMYVASGAGLLSSLNMGKELLPKELNIMGQLKLGYKGADLCRNRSVHGVHAATGVAMLAGPLFMAAPLVIASAPVGLAAAGAALAVGGVIGHGVMYVVRNVGWGFWNPVKYYEKWAGVPLLGDLFKGANGDRFYS